MLVAPETTKIKTNTSRCSSFPLSVHCWQYSHKKGEIKVFQCACAYPSGQAKRDHLSILKSLSLPPDPPPKSHQEIARNYNSLPIWSGSRLEAGQGAAE